MRLFDVTLRNDDGDYAARWYVAAPSAPDAIAKATAHYARLNNGKGSRVEVVKDLGSLVL